jgi:hypothetical protein
MSGNQAVSLGVHAGSSCPIATMNTPSESPVLLLQDAFYRMLIRALGEDWRTID